MKPSRRAPKRTAKAAEPAILDAELTLSQVAAGAGVALGTVHNWHDRDGLKVERRGKSLAIRVRDLLAFLAHRDGAGLPGGERERLAREQADKVAMDNAEKRGELIPADYHADAMSSFAASVAQQLEAIPGRLAGELAGMTDPAAIRARLQDECRSARSELARTIEGLPGVLAAEGVGGGEVGSVDSGAAEASNARPVGRRKPSTPARKRRARKVSK